MRSLILVFLFLISFWCNSEEKVTDFPDAKAARVMGVCQIIANPKNDISNPTVIDETYAAYNYLKKFMGVDHVDVYDLYETTSVLIVDVPAHGKLVHITSDNFRKIFGREPSGDIGNSMYAYIPDINYEGEDSLSVQVNLEGYGAIKVMYYLHMMDRGQVSGPQFSEWSEKPGNNPCGDGEDFIREWKISSTQPRINHEQNT